MPGVSMNSFRSAFMFTPDAFESEDRGACAAAGAEFAKLKTSTKRMKATRRERFIDFLGGFLCRRKTQNRGRRECISETLRVQIETGAEPKAQAAYARQSSARIASRRSRAIWSARFRTIT